MNNESGRQHWIISHNQRPDDITDVPRGDRGEAKQYSMRGLGLSYPLAVRASISPHRPSMGPGGHR